MYLLTNVITMLMNPMQQAFQLPCSKYTNAHENGIQFEIQSL